MREGWQEAKLGEVCTVIAGQSPKGSAYNNVGDGLPFHQGKKYFGAVFLGDSNTWTTQVTKEALPGDILMSVRAPVGPINFTNQHLCIGRGLAAIRATEKVDPKFIYFWLLFKQGEIQGNEGAVFASINKQQIERIDLPLPPLPEQKCIVAILDEAFAGIDTAIASTEKNLANARELFESYLNSVFGERGEGWQIKSVGEFAEHCLGKMLDKQKNKGERRPYLRNVNVQWFQIHTHDVLEMRIEPREEDRFAVKAGDLLICEGGYPGRAAIWDNNNPIFFQKALHRVRCHDSSLNRWLLYYLYFSDSNGELARHFTGAGIQHFTGKALKALRVPLPPKKLISNLLNGIDAVHDEVVRLEAIYQQKLTTLAELKQSLLQKAFSGELTADASNAVEPAEAVLA